MIPSEAIRLLREIRYFECDAPSDLREDMDHLSEVIDALEKHVPRVGGTYDFNWGYADVKYCPDFMNDLGDILPYREWGCGQCDHLMNSAANPPLAGKELRLDCAKGHTIMCFVARMKEEEEPEEVREVEVW